MVRTAEDIFKPLRVFFFSLFIVNEVVRKAKQFHVHSATPEGAKLEMSDISKRGKRTLVSLHVHPA